MSTTSTMNKYLPFVFLCSTLQLQAEPNVSISYKFYDIYPKSFKEIEKEMNDRTPILKNGVRYKGYTAWYVKWRFKWWNDGNSCKITSVSTSLDVSYTMPRIPDNFTVNPSIRKAFNNYYQVLLKHEQGHKDSGLFAARDIEKALLGLGSFNNCKTLETAANNKGHQVIKKYNQRDINYDKRTKHGRLQGVDINRFIPD
ncbi:DUF922 domain-containing Zn-dependent protease [Spartinivicinus poritis]|nr:DUF922 domain-containing Zn-dependent protease [Spartinivicinus sp. A2-2]